MKVRGICVLLTVVLALSAGCSSDTDSAQEESGKKTGKADCPDCDPSGGSAFAQAGFDIDFYRAGDNWAVAYQFKQRNEMAREGIPAQQVGQQADHLPAIDENRQVEISEPFLFKYEVTKVDNRVIDNIQRDVAKIRVIQTAAMDLALFSTQRLDTHEFALEFDLDDLLRPVSETFFNREYPNGKTIPVDRESSLSSLEAGSNLFPHIVPRVLVNVSQANSAAPAMTTELEAIADNMLPGWRTAKYAMYQFANGDVVYWAKGNPWPFYVECQQGYALLTEMNLATR